MDYKPPNHLGLDHDLDHYNLDGTPKFPDADHIKLPTNADLNAQSLDVIRQNKSKLVEEEYHPKDWVMSKINTLKKTSSLKIETIADPKTLEVKDNVISFDITTSNEKATSMNTRMQLIFYQGGIIKFNCMNPANPSKFSFEIVEKPENITPYLVTEKTKVEEKEFQVDLDQEAKLVVNFEPFMAKVVSTKDNSEDPIFRLNTNRSLMFDENITADLTFHTEYLYGIPERAHHLLVEDTKEELPYRFFNLDIFGYGALSKNGLYGCIPIMITRKRDSPTWASVYWQNTSETYLEIHKQEKMSDTFWISERGNLEAYIFVHHSAREHFQAITNVVGKAAMPQLFSLGYHQCRYSYLDQQDILMVNEKFNEHEIPCDTLTLDIDHTDEMRYFTWNYDLFPDPVHMQEQLDRDLRKLITIADPHIKVDDKYKVYQGAALNDLCIKDSDNKTFVGECWPGDSVYLDFLNEETREYWASCYSYENYKDSTPNLFGWNDMNEPSVFESKDKTLPKEALHTVKTLANPEKTFQVEHREVHNIYGYCMSKATYQGFLRREKDQNVRPHALSRSFFAGSQKWCTIWTGDSMTSWEHLKVSVPMLLSMSLCGLSFVGSDVGGFIGDPEPELLVRWYQLGTFMPYFRGHSDKRCKRREPYLYPKRPFELVKEAIKERYRLLPYWYTCFEEHCRNGLPLLRPAWLEQNAHRDDFTLRDEERFMVGDNLLVVPILEPGLDTLKDPIEGMEGRWYDYYTRKEVGYENESIKVGIDRIGCFLKGGSAIPLYEVRSYIKSTRDAKDSNISLYIGLDEEENAKGKMYLDDGETFNYKKGQFLRKSIEFQKNSLSWQDVEQAGYSVNNRVTKAVIMGLKNTNFSNAYLQVEGGNKQIVQFIKKAGHVVLEFVALASKNWRIILH